MARHHRRQTNRRQSRARWRRWFATALLFADKRWGSGTGIFDYKTQAQSILDTMRTTSQRSGIATDMFDPQAHQVVFVPTLSLN